MLVVLLDAYADGKNELNGDPDDISSLPERKTPYQVLKHRLMDQNPYEANLQDCKQALLNSLIDEDQEKID